MHSRIILSAILFTSGLAPAAETVKAGDAAPDIALKAVNVERVPNKKAGDTVSLKDMAGKTVVLFFYPKANTPGCTTESCGFRDLAEKFPANVLLVGVSADDLKAQSKFADDHKLTYTLLCDPECKLIDAMGVGIDGRKMSKRVTVVIDAKGKVAKVYDAVSPAKHAQEVLKQVESMK